MKPSLGEAVDASISSLRDKAGSTWSFLLDKARETLSACTEGTKWFPRYLAGAANTTRAMSERGLSHCGRKPMALLMRAWSVAYGFACEENASHTGPASIGG